MAMEQGLLEATLRKAGLTDYHLAMIAENVMVAQIIATEVIRVCGAMQMALVTASSGRRRRPYTGLVSPQAIMAGVARLAEKRSVLTITALAVELGTTRQNLNRSILGDQGLKTAYFTAVDKAQREGHVPLASPRRRRRKKSLTN